ncbi:CaiB/BaiF CoA transferase family protein [Dactylosporangium sp. CA-233914]|uniref:CaiB/BaiF CoA transferase family protein n=1 Tax=Dactylosporangium sp. CA-233914 TaxID=3239934 RepID=UPI003D8F8994
MTESSELAAREHADDGLPPLAGIKVIDASQLIAGPLATRVLADLGAQVIKVEPPGGEHGRALGRSVLTAGFTAVFAAVNSGKRAISLDLKSKGGREAFDRLAAEADVLVHNARPRIEQSLGLTFERLSEVNPRLIVVGITGFGRRGPNVDKPAVDLVVQGMSGLLMINGYPDAPVRVATTVIDNQAAWIAACATVSALVQRARTGLGEQIDVNLYDAALSIQASNVTDYLASGVLPKRTGNDAQLGAPAGVYETATTSIVVSAYFPDHWRSLCHLLGIPDIEHDPRFKDNDARLRHQAELNTVLAPRFLAEPATLWLERFEAAGITCGPVADYAEVCASEQAAVSQILADIGTAATGPVRTVDLPITIRGERVGTSRRLPVLDACREQVLATGFEPDQATTSTR